ncbi:hypothetical protein [Cellulosilyticum ruminicola]|uniref:hypothetical protein n=1 Tax=Cellulosilyticum ruminicola TaxID=425254 RepID=UPI0006D1A379|nr:hypothetical protein [Cellulosilyticum ruminicola]
MSKSVIMGCFNSEAFWKEGHTCDLPTLREKETANIIETMDEMLFVLGKSGDFLMTKYQMPKFFERYLNEVGFEFECVAPEETAKIAGSYLNTYAVLPNTEAILNQYDLKGNFPSIKCVRLVNSKSYSTRLYEKIGLKPIGQIVTNLDELMEVGNQLLEAGDFLIKEPMGVSGQGNLLIDGEKTLSRMKRYFEKQEKKGKKIEFILEPMLQKKIDFSCEFELDEAGNVNFLSIQKILNKGFGYLGSVTADADFKAFLESKDYFNVMLKVGENLHEAGYFGSVCVDSMILEDDQIVPIVEINARKSMGFINYYVAQKVLPMGYQSMLTFLSVGYEGQISFKDFFESLKAAGLLFDREKGYVLPLTSHALTINSTESKTQSMHKGRLYVAILYKENQQPEVLLKEFKDFCINYGMKLYN